MNVNLQYVLDGLIGIAAIVWICYRQMTWRVVDPARMWRGPLIFAIIGAGVIFTGSKTITVSSGAIALLAVELILGVGIGAAMGAIAHFRRLTPAAAAAYEAKRRPDRYGTVGGPIEYETRTSWVGLALWAVLIVIRVGLSLFGRHFGIEAASSTGIILLLLSANRLARVAVLAWRLEQHRNSLPQATV